MILLHISISRGHILGREKFETILVYGAAGEYEILEQVGKRYWFNGHLPRYQISKQDWKSRRDELLAVVPSDMAQQHTGETRWFREAPISWFHPEEVVE